MQARHGQRYVRVGRRAGSWPWAQPILGPCSVPRAILPPCHMGGACGGHGCAELLCSPRCSWQAHLRPRSVEPDIVRHIAGVSGVPGTSASSARPSALACAGARRPASPRVSSSSSTCSLSRVSAAADTVLSTASRPFPAAQAPGARAATKRACRSDPRAHRPDAHWHLRGGVCLSLGVLRRVEGAHACRDLIGFVLRCGVPVRHYEGRGRPRRA
ncbi:hypothetical protein B0H15DRAFT_857074 [Mycena belliarum]|uniref:Uncharacterized protein n=1 Tax=Mycena belliarum TaxID=1033014 RepID=A0AAD6U096_9AGAR|nr:hypothetical protein B0H15DRAFT_857074 [Mycena belliae]